MSLFFPTEAIYFLIHIPATDLEAVDVLPEVLGAPEDLPLEPVEHMSFADHMSKVESLLSEILSI